MSTEQFSNNATTTLGSSASSGTTTITVASGTGSEFPNPTGGQFFSATLWAAGSTTGTPNEIVYCTARSGDTMTVVRGREGTTAQAWAVGDTFANYPTAAWYNGVASITDIQSQFGNSATDSGTANAGVVTLAPVPAGLSSLLLSPIRIFKGGAANTGAYTINVNGLGVHAVTINGAAIPAGKLPASQIFEVVWDGTNFELLSAAGPSGGLIALRVFTSSGTYTPTAGTTSIEVTAVGGGGGGGGSAAMSASQFAAAGGGGAGGTSVSRLTTGFSSVAVTIGAGGAGGTGAANGSAGSATSFGSVAANGGAGGSFANAAAIASTQLGGGGGTASGGSIFNSIGGAGGSAIAFGSTNLVSGSGGNSTLGGGGPAIAGTANGQNGQGPGGGASGAVGQNSATAQAGGTGANGIVIVREYA